MEQIQEFTIPALYGEHVAMMPADADVFHLRISDDLEHITLSATVTVSGEDMSQGPDEEREFAVSVGGEILPSPRFAGWTKAYRGSAFRRREMICLHVWEILKHVGEATGEPMRAVPEGECVECGVSGHNHDDGCSLHPQYRKGETT